MARPHRVPQGRRPPRARGQRPGCRPARQHRSGSPAVRRGAAELDRLVGAVRPGQRRRRDHRRRRPVGLRARRRARRAGGVAPAAARRDRRRALRDPARRRPRRRARGGPRALVAWRTSTAGCPATAGAHLRSAPEMLVRHARHPQAVATAAALGDECAFDLALVAPNLPPYPVPPGHTEASLAAGDRLGGARGAGTGRRTRSGCPGAYAQIAHELDVIEELDFPGYFLIVHDLVDFCRRQRHPRARAAARPPTRRSATRSGSPPWTRCGTGCCSSASSPPSGTGRRTSTSTSSPTAARRSSSTSTRSSAAPTPRRSPTSSPTARSPRCATPPARSGYDVGQQDAWSKSIEQWGSLRDVSPVLRRCREDLGVPTGTTPSPAAPTPESAEADGRDPRARCSTSPSGSCGCRGTWASTPAGW